MAYPGLFPTPVRYLCSREDSNGPSGETQAQRVDSHSFYPAGPSRAERPESSCWLKFLQAPKAGRAVGPREGLRLKEGPCPVPGAITPTSRS